MAGLGCELDPLAGDRLRDLGDLDRAVDQPRCGGRIDDEAAGESPGAVVHHPYGEAALVSVVAGLQAGVVQRQI